MRHLESPSRVEPSRELKNRYYLVRSESGHSCSHRRWCCSTWAVDGVWRTFSDAERSVRSKSQPPLSVPDGLLAANFRLCSRFTAYQNLHPKYKRYNNGSTQESNLSIRGFTACCKGWRKVERQNKTGNSQARPPIVVWLKWHFCRVTWWMLQKNIVRD